MHGKTEIHPCLSHLSLCTAEELLTPGIAHSTTHYQLSSLLCFGACIDSSSGRCPPCLCFDVACCMSFAHPSSGCQVGEHLETLSPQPAAPAQQPADGEQASGGDNASPARGSAGRTSRSAVSETQGHLNGVHTYPVVPRVPVHAQSRRPAYSQKHEGGCRGSQQRVSLGGHLCQCNHALRDNSGCIPA